MSSRASHEITSLASKSDKSTPPRLIIINSLSLSLSACVCSILSLPNGTLWGEWPFIKYVFFPLAWRAEVWAKLGYASACAKGLGLVLSSMLARAHGDDNDTNLVVGVCTY